MVKVSVIIPYYNGQRFIQQCIDSVLKQSYKNFEIILIDDGSTDEVDRVLELFGHQIRYLKQNKKGPAAARNYGIKEAKGEYVAFLDSDDIWLPKKLKLQVEFLDKNRDFSLVYSDLALFDENGVIDENLYFSKGIPRPSGFIFKELVLNCLFSTVTVMIRKSIFDTSSYLFDEQLLIGEDYDLWLRLAKRYKIGYLSGVLAMYRQHSGSLIHSVPLTPTGIPWENQVIERILSIYPEEQKKINPRKLRKRLARPYFELGCSYFFEKKYLIAKKYFKKSVQIYRLEFNSFLYYILCLIHPKVTENLMKVYRKLKPA